jgi:hypothetical protein
MTYIKKNHEIEKKALAQPELSSRSDYRACFVVDGRISFYPVKNPDMVIVLHLIITAQKVEKNI